MNKSIYVKNDFTLKLNEDSIITLVLTGNQIKLNYELENGEYKILVFNNSKTNIKIFEKGYIKNSNVLITYIELNDNKYNQINNIEVYKESSLNINSIYLGINDKDIKFDITNKESDSLVNIVNNVVCLERSKFNLEIIGNIIKNAKRAKCHQKSSCLTFGNPKEAVVLPVLNIDENDVEASHSLSCGTIDEEVLFYMNSRGLDKKDALKLLLTSYLMPNDEFYKEYIDGDFVKEITKESVIELCSM